MKIYTLLSVMPAIGLATAYYEPDQDLFRRHPSLAISRRYVEPRGSQAAIPTPLSRRAARKQAAQPKPAPASSPNPQPKDATKARIASLGALVKPGSAKLIAQAKARGFKAPKKDNKPAALSKPDSSPTPPATSDNSAADAAKARSDADAAATQQTSNLAGAAAVTSVATSLLMRKRDDVGFGVVRTPVKRSIWRSMKQRRSI